MSDQNAKTGQAIMKERGCVWLLDWGHLCQTLLVQIIFQLVVWVPALEFPPAAAVSVLVDCPREA